MRAASSTAARVTIFTAAAAAFGVLRARPVHAAAAASSSANSGGVCVPLSDAIANDDDDDAGPRWRVRPTLGDGSCLFRAVVQGASLADDGLELPPDGEERAARALRQQVVQALRDHRSDIEPFLPGIAPDFDAYCARMSREGQWGGEPELAMAATHVLRRPLAVYSARLGDQIARAGGVASRSGGRHSNAADEANGAGLPAPVVTYGEEFVGDPSAPGVVRLLWSGNHYETLVDERRARQAPRRANEGNDGNGGSSGSAGGGGGGGGQGGGGAPRSRL